MVFFHYGLSCVTRLKHPNVCIHQFAGIKMGKNFTVDEAVVGKIKRNLICSRSIVHVVGACHKCRINFKWSNDTTTEEKVEGVHKDGLVGEIRRYSKQNSCDLGENAE